MYLNKFAQNIHFLFYSQFAYFFIALHNCRNDQFAVSYFYNWEIRHHSLVRRCGLTDFLYNKVGVDVDVDVDWYLDWLWYFFKGWGQEPITWLGVGGSSLNFRRLLRVVLLKGENDSK